MTPDIEGSVTGWIGGLKAGNHTSVERLWERYFDRLVCLARGRLRGASRDGVDADEEDAALSAFDNLCRDAARGQYPALADREGLWKLLVVLTVRKSLNQIEHRSAQKRGGGRVVRESELRPSYAGHAGDGLDGFAGDEPSPEFNALVADEYRRARDALGEDSLRLVFDLLMEGFTRQEIASRMGCAVRTVTRKLELVREALTGEES
ncbi:MAG: RNA polymerase subunit sigma-70 [Planctomycetia bacterium]|nr:RNA polymerase subunit sigma-70 [Planctomycetia bacterium]